MPKTPRQASYLQQRGRTWYFRFKLPTRIQSVAERTEIRVSLDTCELSAARERVAILLPYVHSLKRLARQMSKLTPEDVQTALDLYFTDIVEELERSKAPWLRPSAPIGTYPGMNLGHCMSDCLLSPHEKYDFFARTTKSAIRQKQYAQGASLASRYLEQVGCDADEDSERFRELCLDLLKLKAMHLETKKARANGDYQAENEFIAYYKRAGYSILSSTEGPADAGPTISEAWQRYYAEKTAGRPQPDWSVETAQGQQATFEEFKDIAGDLPVRQVTRDVILDYLEKVGRLPRNRTKTYPGKSISDLLALDIPESQRPSPRTVAEKLIRVGAFFRWCRVSQGYLDADPAEGIKVRSDSRSYVPFTEGDLALLFYSQEYRRDSHRSLWQFWIPLVALYTGARQSEIAQLMVGDIVQEDGIWLFSITDFGEDQKVKTSAGIRKVPMSEILIDLGFIDYIDYLKDQSIQRVFPDLEKGSRSWGQRVSRWFNDTYKDRCGVRPDPTGGRKVFHSFRHTAITKALSANIPIQHCQQVFGHERSILGETATYTHQFPVKSLIPVIAALDWDLNHLPHRHRWTAYVEDKL